MIRVPALTALVGVALSCHAVDSRLEASERQTAAGHAIVVAGERFSVDAAVVLWHEPPFYSAYSTEPRFSSDGAIGLRYRPQRAGRDASFEPSAGRFERVTRVVDQFILHYDACGTSRTCFEVLQDLRQLSVHFLLDVDGTIYQTLDLEAQAWHASQANSRSIGIEIAHIGAYPFDDAGRLDEWYVEGDDETRLQLPERLAGGGVRTPDFDRRLARATRISGEVQGEVFVQYDFTEEQYRSLAALTATLVRVFPRIELAVPRDSNGVVRTSVMSQTEQAAFHGILGHFHSSGRKRDPGPAFDWERFTADVAARLAQSP